MTWIVWWCSCSSCCCSRCCCWGAGRECWCCRRCGRWCCCGDCVCCCCCCCCGSSCWGSWSSHCAARYCTVWSNCCQWWFYGKKSCKFFSDTTWLYLDFDGSHIRRTLFLYWRTWSPLQHCLLLAMSMLAVSSVCDTTLPCAVLVSQSTSSLASAQSATPSQRLLALT